MSTGAAVLNDEFDEGVVCLVIEQLTCQRRHFQDLIASAIGIKGKMVFVWLYQPFGDILELSWISASPHAPLTTAELNLTMDVVDEVFC